MRKCLFLVICLAALDARAAEPSRAVILSCLSARAVSSSITWRAFSTKEINSQDDYQDGFNAIYYLVVQGTEIGYAEKGAVKGILFDHKIYPVDSARALFGFSVRPTELNPYLAEWGAVADRSGKFACVSFPFGGLGQSGSFQGNRSAYLMSLTASKKSRLLYSATGNIDVIRYPLGGKSSFNDRKRPFMLRLPCFS